MVVAECDVMTRDRYLHPTKVMCFQGCRRCILYCVQKRGSLRHLDSVLLTAQGGISHVSCRMHGEISRSVPQMTLPVRYLATKRRNRTAQVPRNTRTFPFLCRNVHITPLPVARLEREEVYRGTVSRGLAVR